MRLLVSAGGTGGGIYPALAVVDALEGDVDVLWIGEEGGMAADLVRRSGVRFEAIPAAGVHGVGLRRLPSNAWQLLKGYRRARDLIKAFDPDALFFTGGYIGIPVALAGFRRKIAAFIPDIEPAIALRIILRLANWVAITTRETRSFLPRGKQVLEAGYPVRREIRSKSRLEARAAMHLVSEKPLLLVFGGSRGARSINRALWDHLPEVLELAEIVHITGSLDWPQLNAQRPSLSNEQALRYHAYEYLHEEMADALRAADLVLSRAGASVLGEYPAVGVASILVPYPHAWRYQKVNARFLVDNGASILLEDDRLDTELFEAIAILLSDRAKLDSMAKSAAALDRPQAAARIAGELQSTMGGRP